VDLNRAGIEQLRFTGDDEAPHLQTAPGAARCRRRVVALIERDRETLGDTVLDYVECNRSGVNVSAAVHYFETE